MQLTRARAWSKPPGREQGDSSQWAGVGSIMVMTSVDSVQAQVGSTAVVKSGAGVTITATMSNTTRNATVATLVVDPTKSSKVAAALAVTISVMEPTVKATVADFAHIDASAAVTVKADLEYPFLFPTSADSSTTLQEDNPFAVALIKGIGNKLGLDAEGRFGLQTTILGLYGIFRSLPASAVTSTTTSAASTTGTPSADGTTPGAAKVGFGEPSIFITKPTMSKPSSAMHSSIRT